MSSKTTEFANLLEAVPDALVGVDKAGVIRFVNHQTESLFGYERGDLVGALLEMLVPESARQVHAEHRGGYSAAPRTRPMGTDLKLSGRRRDGTEFPADISLSPMETGDGLLVIAAVRDMTHYRVAEAVRRRLDRLSAVVEFSGEAITSGTRDGIITTWNPAAGRMYGYSGEEMIGKPIKLLVSQDRTDELKVILEKIRTGEAIECLQTVGVRKDGTVFPVSLTISSMLDADGSVVGASLITRDVTRQREAFEAAQLMAAVIEFSGEAISTSRLDGIMECWNPAAERLFGYSREEMVGKSGRRLSLGDRTQEVCEILARIGAGGSVETLESIRVRKDGTVFPVSLTVSPIRDKDGAIVGASAITRDLTEHQKAVKSAQSMATIVEQANDAILSTTLDGRITTWNPAAERQYGYSSLEMIGKSIELLNPKDRPGEIIAVTAKVIAGQPVEHFETMRVRKGGTLVAVSQNVSPIRDAGGAVVGISVVSRDVTDQMEAKRAIAERQARELDRLVELERFQRLTVGRELKMIELKKEIEYLRKLGSSMAREPDHEG